MRKSTGKVSKKTTKRLQNDSLNPPRELPNEPRVPDADWQNPLWRPLGFPSDPFGAQSDPWGAPRYPLGTPREPNKHQKQVPGGRSDLSRDPKSPSGCSLGPLGVAAVVVVAVLLLPSLLLYCPCCRCRCCLFFVAVLSFIAMICSSLPRALDSITHRHDCSHNRAGGMRGAIE